MADTMIEVAGLTKTFGTFTAVDSIDFSVDRGSIFGLLGANGAGKTTTIRILCGLMTADAGRVRLADVDVRADPEAAKRRIGYMSQRFSLYRDLTAEENLEFFGGLYGANAAARSDGRRRLLDAVGLAGLERELAGDLAGGLTQRLALACAMVHRPPVIFLDEPTSGVDPASRRRFWDLIHDQADRGTTVVITTHYLDEAEYCDRLVLMHAGRIVASGSPGDLKRDAVPGPVLAVGGSDAMTLEDTLAAEAGVVETSLFGDALHLQFDTGWTEADARSLVETAVRGREVSVDSIVPSLEDVFLRIIDRSEELP